VWSDFDSSADIDLVDHVLDMNLDFVVTALTLKNGIVWVRTLKLND
jgi:hypothetical protein